jgi:PPM family protein phosphatase
MIKSASLSHQGLVRHQNEDSIVDDAPLGLWVVADGVGGNGCGEVASQIATQILQRKVRQGEHLVEAALLANRAIVEAAQQKIEYRHMATTVVACHVHGSAYEIAWVGDSRAYLLDARQISQLTTDHNVAGELLAQGALRSEEASHHAGQHELTLALGHLGTKKPSVSVGELHHGEYLLLCTDGLTGVMTDAEIHQIVLASSSLQQATQHLLDAVLARGAPDNVSIVLLHYVDERPKLQPGDFDRAARVAKPGSSRVWLLMLLVAGLILLGWAL